MQLCASLRTDNRASTPPLSFFTGRMPFLPPNQQRQSTEGKVVAIIIIIIIIVHSAADVDSGMLTAELMMLIRHLFNVVYSCIIVALQSSSSMHRQISGLVYPKIQRRQVVMNVLYPGCSRPPRWSPPVLWRRFVDACIVIHSCKMSKESETTGLNDR